MPSPSTDGLMNHNTGTCVILDRENRYLLFLTENYAALEILQQYLQDQEHVQPALSVPSDKLKPWKMEPYVLFGSSFPKDKEYTQVSISITKLPTVDFLTQCPPPRYILPTRCVGISTRSRYVWRLVGWLSC